MVNVIAAEQTQAQTPEEFFLSALAQVVTLVDLCDLIQCRGPALSSQTSSLVSGAFWVLEAPLWREKGQWTVYWVGLRQEVGCLFLSFLPLPAEDAVGLQAQGDHPNFQQAHS